VPTLTGNQNITAFDCINNTSKNSMNKTTVEKFMQGSWLLKGMVTATAIENVPKIMISFGSNLTINNQEITNQVTYVYFSKDDKLIGNVVYTLKEDFREGLTHTSFETEELKIGNTEEDNFIKGEIRICENELYIDNTAIEGTPGYLFRKIK
jgi:hypothetical protein